MTYYFWLGKDAEQESYNEYMKEAMAKWVSIQEPWPV